jgi:hypothetical protein
MEYQFRLSPGEQFILASLTIRDEKFSLLIWCSSSNLMLKNYFPAQKTDQIF